MELSKVKFVCYPMLQVTFSIDMREHTVYHKFRVLKLYLLDCSAGCMTVILVHTLNFTLEIDVINLKSIRSPAFQIKMRYPTEEKEMKA